MNNLRKIICAVLVFALLCGTLVFATSAEPGAEFTPGRTLAVPGDRVAATASTAEGNLFVQLDDFNNNSKYMLKNYIVTEAGNDDTYWLSRMENNGNSVSITSDGHAHTNLYIKETVDGVAHFGHPLKADDVIVYESDMYFEDAMYSGLYVNLNMRDTAGEGPYAGTSLASNQDRNLAAKLPIGEWFHLTVLGDVNNDIVYWYLNGELIHSTAKGVRNGIDIQHQTTKDGVTTDHHYTYYGMRWQFNNATLEHGQSFAVDNVFSNIITTADLGTYTMGAATLAGFDKAQSYTLRDTIPLAIANGVEYDSAAKLNQLLAESTDPVEVELLRDANAAITVNCDATVNTNGVNTVVKAGTGVKSSNEGNIYIFDAPYGGTQKDTEKVSQADFIAAVRYNAEDNQLKTAGLNYCGYNAPYNQTVGSGESAVTYLREQYHIAYSSVNTADKNVFGMIQPYGTLGNFNTYIDMKLGENGAEFNGVYYSEAAADGYYVVVEFDAARLGAVSALPAYIVARETNDSNANTGTQWSSQYDMGAAVFSKLPNDGFGHVTLVAVANENKGYFYIDGKLVATADNFFFNSTGYTHFKNGQRIKLDAFRFGGNSNMPMAYENMYLRVKKGSEFGNLTTLAGTEDITSWDKGVYGTYETPALPVLATVDGVDVYNTADLATALVGEDVVNVEIKKNFYTEVAVNGNAVINTNGLVTNFVAGEGATFDTSVENIITATIPYIPAYGTTDATGAGSAVLAGSSVVAGGVANWSPTIDGVATDLLEDWEVLPTTGGDSYLKVSPTMDFTIVGQNPFYGISVGKELSLNGYYVIDFDIATEGEYINMSINPTIRNLDENGSTIGGKYPDGMSIFFKSFLAPSNQWAHVTAIGDMANNVMYLFIDGELANANFGYAYRNDANYLGGRLRFDSIRFNLGGNGNQIKDIESALLNNLDVRLYGNGEKATFDAAVAAESLAGWSGNQYKGNAQLPGIITIDKAPYGNSVVASEALSVEGEAPYNVAFKADFEYPVTIGASATLDTNGIGAYEIFAGAPVETEVEGEMAIIYAPIAFEVDGEIVTTTKLTEENVYDFATSVYWCYGDINDDIYSEYETVYYPAGTAITYYGNNAAATYGNYIVDGTLTTLKGWYAEDAYDEYVTEFGIATAGDSYSYVADIATAATEITLPGAMYNLSLSTNYKINLFVPKTAYVGEGETVTAGGVEYVVLTKGVAATEIANAVEFLVTYTVEGVEYTEVVEVSVLEYAEKVMASDYSKMLKRTIMAALNYSETAIEELVTAEGDAAIKAILNAEANAEFKTEDTGDYGAPVNFENLTFLTGGQVHIDAAPDFVFNVRKGFVGTITFTYEGVEGTVVVTKEVDASEAGVQISLNDIKVYDLAATFTIASEGTITASGEFTLGTYIQALAESNNDSATAKALYVYAGVANIYKKACIAASAEA